MKKKVKPMKKILIIGGGASGIMAALSASSSQNQVTIYEKADRIGKKILATGNGKCNLTNLNMGTEFYYTDQEQKMAECLQVFSEKDTLSFFENLGLMTRDREGYVYPYCEQAAVVLDILREALERKKVIMHTSVTDIRLQADSKNRFHVNSSIGKEIFDAVILACGSKAGIKNAASDTSVTTDGYDFAIQFGHHMKKLYPALVQVRCREPFFKMIAGVRAKASVSLYADHAVIAKEQGEVQFTDYGISGIPVFQISRIIAGLLDDKKKKTVVCLDFFHHMSEKDWTEYYLKRLEKYWEKTAEEFLLGMLHKKLSAMMLKEHGLKPDNPVNENTVKVLKQICSDMKHFIVTPKQVNPFEQAQVCRGGIDFSELDDTLQSHYQKNLYLCGEMIDIDGKCGGYNLQWAWTSGYIAGKASADTLAYKNGTAKENANKKQKGMKSAEYDSN